MTSLKAREDTSSSPTILAVDDNPTALHLLVSTLKRENYQVLTATNGIEAMDILEQHGESIDTILLDRMMPEMDGMEVTKRVLKNPPLKYIPIIMQTAADKPEEISEGIKAGVFYYLTKPIERSMLLSIVSSAIKEIQQRRVLEAEMRRHRMSFGLVEVLKSSCRTLEEAESISSFLANCFPDAERALTGISELLFNAVEHGNLSIDYDEKTTLMDSNSWREEVEKRLQLPEFASKKVTVIFERKDETYYLQVTDQGKGFNWKSFMQFDPSRASHNHGRGIAMANIIAFDRLLYNDAGNQVTAVMKKQAPTKDTDDYWG